MTFFKPIRIVFRDGSMACAQPKGFLGEALNQVLKTQAALSARDARRLPAWRA